MFLTRFAPLAAALFLCVLTAPAKAQNLYGTLSNFDVFNDTGSEAHGFEIELDGLTSQDVGYTFAAPYIRYSTPALVDFAGGVYVRYESPYDAAQGAFTLTTPIPAAMTPTAGHSCWTGGAPGYLTSGCEHFGLGLMKSPTAVTYRWLLADPATPGALKPSGTNVSIPAPIWSVIPAAPGAAAVVQAAIEPPPAPPAQFGDAVWVKAYETESPERADLHHLVTDDPAVPQSPAQIEVEWELSQSNPRKAGRGVLQHGKPLGAGNHSVTRRFEFYKFTGQYDPLTHQAVCAAGAGGGHGAGDCVTPGPGELGDYIGAQMAAAQLAPAPVLRIGETHAAAFLQGQAGAVYSVVVSNDAAAIATSGLVTVTETAPAGLTLVSMSGPGWTCAAPTCTRSDVLNPGASYPPITVTVNVAPDAPPQVVNQVDVSGGGASPATTTDPTVVAGPPAAPLLAWPADGAIGVVAAPVLTWNPTAGAASYDVYFGTSSAPPLVTNLAATSYAPAPLTAATTYYWQVVARNAAGTAGSPIRSFTTALPQEGLRFVPVTPCRVADTRNSTTMLGGSTRSFPVQQSPCGIPATALAYSLNVTVVPAGPLSFLTLWPAGQPQPVVSTLNSFSGQVVANAAIVPAGTGGAVNVFVSGTTDVILDVNGYFDTSNGQNSLAFYPSAPCRVLDSRNPVGPFGGPGMTGGEKRDIQVPLSPCGIPATAGAFSLNVTVVPDPVQHYLGFLTAWPAGQPQPNASTLNSWTGKVLANAAIVPAGTNESISVYASNPTDLILDTNGYFATPGGQGALLFYPVTPCRVADTRGAAGPKMGTAEVRSFAIPAGGCNIPSNAAAYSLNVTVVPDGFLAYLTAWPAGASQPNVSTLNSWDGSVVANAAIVPAGANGAVSVFVANPSHVILDIDGYFAP